MPLIKSSLLHAIVFFRSYNSDFLFPPQNKKIEILIAIFNLTTDMLSHNSELSLNFEIN